MYSPSHSTGISLAAGAFTWLTLNRHTMRGDFMLAFFAGIVVVFFLRSLLTTGLFFNSIRESTEWFSVYAFSVIACTILYRLSPLHPLSAFPGPTLWSWTSLRLVASSWTGYRHITIDSLHKEYGKFVRIGPNHLSIQSPSTLAAIYSASSMEKSHSYDPPGHVENVSLFFNHSREEQAARKRIWSAAFTSIASLGYCQPLSRQVGRLIQVIEEETRSGRFIDISQFLAFWSYDFMGDMVFGGCTDLELLRDRDPKGLIAGGKKAIAIVDSIGQAPWLLDILWHLPVSQDIHKLRDAAVHMMRKRIAVGNVDDIHDLCSHLMGAQNDGPGSPIPQADLEIEALVAMQAGSDNTATILGLAFFFLLTNKGLYLKLQTEIDSQFSVEQDMESPSRLGELPYLNAVIHETLRLGTPFFLPRIVPKEGVMIDGRYIPGGTVVAAVAYSQQTSEEIFGQDALIFRPERWIEQSNLDKAQLLSFSTGRFACVAKTFAMHELRFVLASLVFHFNMSLKPGFNGPEFCGGIRNARTTTFDFPLLVTAEPRWMDSI